MNEANYALHGDVAVVLIDNPPGNGLGNLKRRLQAIGGSFTLESRLGAGTTVSLLLPVAAAAAGSV